MTPMEEFADVTQVEVVGEYRLRLTFADSTIGDVDFVGRAWPELARVRALARKMEPTGIEPVTSCLQSRRSPS
jgi:hypothetical protein